MSDDDYVCSVSTIADTIAAKAEAQRRRAAELRQLTIEQRERAIGMRRPKRKDLLQIGAAVSIMWRNRSIRTQARKGVGSSRQCHLRRLQLIGAMLSGTERQKQVKCEAGLSKIMNIASERLSRLAYGRASAGSRPSAGPPSKQLREFQASVLEVAERLKEARDCRSQSRH